MKNKIFIVISIATVLVVLCVGAVFASAYLFTDLQNEPKVEEYAYPEEIVLNSPTQDKNITAKLYEEPQSKNALAQYEAGEDVYWVRKGKLVGELHLSLAGEELDTTKSISMDKALELSYDFFSDEEGFGDCTLTKEWVNNSNHYQFEFRKTYGKDGGFVGSTGFIIQIRKDGEIFSWHTPGPGMDDFDPASVADLTVDDMREYCAEQIDGEFEFDILMIEKIDGEYKIGCSCVIDNGIDHKIVYYPIG